MDVPMHQGRDLYALLYSSPLFAIFSPTMKEFRLGITTNVWNAFRYALFTLLLVPLAEKLWARIHSKRTGKRIMHGGKARLRGSRLAHWGLHQEVDENSRTSKVSAIAVCVLHIAGALLLEYGSGSVDTHIFQDALLSRSLSDDGGLRSNGAYFFDAGYVFGKPYGSIDCIDGEPRSLKDFGLELKKKRRARIISFGDIPAPRRNADRQAEYFIRNTGHHFQLFDNGSTRWYEYNKNETWNCPSQFFSGFANKSVSCELFEIGSVQCYKNEGKVEQGEFLSDILADHFASGRIRTNFYRRLANTTMSVLLNRVSVSSERRPSRQVEAVLQTEWVRGGMPLSRIPKRTLMYLNLNTTEFRDGCGHKHAIPVSNLRKLEGLKVSKPMFPGTLHIWKGDHKPIVWMNGDRPALGTLTHSKNEYCALHLDLRLCFTLASNGKHELALYTYRRRIRSFEVYNKQFNVSVQGVIYERDVLDLVVQSCAEVYRPDPFVSGLVFFDAEKRIIRLVRSGNIVSGLVRLEGKGIQGKSSLRKSDIATINILGLLGTATLIFLVAAPTIPMLFCYREGFGADIESSFRRAVMEIDGLQNCQEVPDRAPSIVSKDIGEGAHVISHTYKM